VGRNSPFFDALTGSGTMTRIREQRVRTLTIGANNGSGFSTHDEK